MACDEDDKNDDASGGDTCSSMNMDMSMGDDSTASGGATGSSYILGGAAGSGDDIVSNNIKERWRV